MTARLTLLTICAMLNNIEDGPQRNTTESGNLKDTIHKHTPKNTLLYLDH